MSQGNSTKKTSIAEQPSNIVRVYELWQEKTQFLCGGRWMQGPNFKLTLLSLVILILPSVLHIIFFNATREISIILTILTTSLLLNTALADPGIVPRLDQVFNDREYSEIPKDPMITQRPSGFVMIDRSGLTQNFKICETCGIFKDKERHHCKTCDNCVTGFDHHCKNQNR